jgi:hypothetical protein
VIGWGETPSTTCPCGQPPHQCRVCGPEAERAQAHDATALIVAVLAVVGLLLTAAPDAWRREQAFEDQQRREHLQRLEAARPGALETLREMARDRQ